MARKLRFFKEQMTKAGVSTSPVQLMETRWDFDELEVSVHVLLPYCAQVINLEFLY
jgi:hypothetical protein